MQQRKRKRRTGNNNNNNNMMLAFAIPPNRQPQPRRTLVWTDRSIDSLGRDGAIAGGDDASEAGGLDELGSDELLWVFFFGFFGFFCVEESYKVCVCNLP